MAASKPSAEQLITENIDVWTSAIKKRGSQGRGSSKKITLYGIKKLRELILELAVRGLLVPQDSNDEPASVLLEKIAAEKKQLLDEKKIKPQKKAQVFEQSIKTDSLPIGWVAADFGDITFNRDAERTPLSVSDRNMRQGEYDYYGASGVIDSIDDYLYEKPLLLIGEDGANLVNRSTPIAFMAYGKYWVNNHAHVLDGINEEFLIYLSLYINSISLLPYITGMAQPKMNQAKMNSILVLLPPEAEQPRIVAKVNELMALCDQLEQQTESSLTAHQALVETLLNTLLTAAQTTGTKVSNSQSNSNQESSFDQAWNRIAQHFDVLFTTEHSIDQLKQTILQLAVMGKLVPQDSNDEPASVLLEKIAAEKEQLIKDKKIKKQKALPPIGDDEKPFELPQGWEWVRLQDVTSLITDGKHGDCNNLQNSGYFFLSAKNISNGQLSYDNARQIVPNEFSEVHQRTNLEAGDICMVNTGATVGKLAIAQDHQFTNRSTFQKSVAVIKVVKPYVDSLYVSHFLVSERPKLLMKSGGSAINNLLLGDLKKKIFPLPPLNEQLNINCKVNELMALCSTLKIQITESQVIQLHLADAMAENALV